MARAVGQEAGEGSPPSADVLQSSMPYPWQPDDLPWPADSGAPAHIITAESLDSQADYLKQAVIAVERTHLVFTAVLTREHPLTAALRYPERKSETNLGSRPQSPRPSLQEVKDLGEDLVLQAREQVATLTRGERSENIWSEVTGQPLQ